MSLIITYHRDLHGDIDAHWCVGVVSNRPIDHVKICSCYDYPVSAHGGVLSLALVIVLLFGMLCSSP